MVYCGGGLAAQTNSVVLGDLMARIALVRCASVYCETDLVVHVVSVLGVVALFVVLVALVTLASLAALAAQAAQAALAAQGA